MTRTSFISTVTILASLAVGGIAFRSWLEARDDRLQMQATLNTQKQLIVAAEQREQQRATELKNTLTQIAALKRQVQTPQQIIRELPQYLPLPKPIQFAPIGSQQSTAAQDSGPAQQGSSVGTTKENALIGPSHYGEPIPDAPKPQTPKIGANAPALGRGNVSALGEANVPPLGGAKLPTRSEADVPAPGEANVPPLGGVNLPARSEGDVPAGIPSRKRATGIDASPGVPVGKPVFTTQNDANAVGNPVSTDPNDATVPRAVQFPVEDLKPLYDFVQDCRACRAQLDVARADLSDERAKSTALMKERDAAIRAAKGGGFWTRLRRNAEWFALGAGTGVALAHAAH